MQHSISAPAGRVPVQRDDNKNKEKTGGSVGVETGVDAKTGDKTIKVPVKVNYEIETPDKKISKLKCKVKGKVTLTGTLTAEVKDPANLPADAPKVSGAKNKDEAASIATEFGKEFSQTAWKRDYEHDAGELQSFEISFKEGGKGDPAKGQTAGKPPEDTAGEVSVGAEAKLTFKSGAEAMATFNLFKLAGSKDGLPFDITVAEVGVSQKHPVLKIPEDTEFKGVKISGGLDVTYGFTIAPDPKELALEILSRYGKTILGRLGISALNAVRNILASGPAMIGFLGGYIMIKATLATIEDTQEMWRVSNDSKDAVAGYVAGFMAGCNAQGVAEGVKAPHSAAGQAWYQDGLMRGGGAMVVMAEKIVQDPMLRHFEFSKGEVFEALTLAMQEHGGSFAQELRSMVDPRIKSLYVQEWRKKADAEFFRGGVEGDQVKLRAHMGDKDPFGALPDPFPGKVPSPAAGNGHPATP